MAVIQRQPSSRLKNRRRLKNLRRSYELARKEFARLKELYEKDEVGTESAVEAVSTWRFEPATLEGKPVAVYYLVTVSFSVQ